MQILNKEAKQNYRNEVQQRERDTIIGYIHRGIRFVIDPSNRH